MFYDSLSPACFLQKINLLKQTDKKTLNLESPLGVAHGKGSHYARPKKKEFTPRIFQAQGRAPHPAPGRQGGAFPVETLRKPGQPEALPCWPLSWIRALEQLIPETANCSLAGLAGREQLQEQLGFF